MSAEPASCGQFYSSGHPVKGGHGFFFSIFSTALDWGPPSGSGSRVSSSSALPVHHIKGGGSLFDYHYPIDSPFVAHFSIIKWLTFRLTNTLTRMLAAL